MTSVVSIAGNRVWKTVDLESWERAVLGVRILPWNRCFYYDHLFRVPLNWAGSVQMKSSKSTFKVAYNSGMFDNSHLLIMQYFFWNDLSKFSKRLVNPKEEMPKFWVALRCNFWSYLAFSLIILWRKNLEKGKLHNHRIKFKTLNLLYGKEYWHMNSVNQS